MRVKTVSQITEHRAKTVLREEAIESEQSVIPRALGRGPR